tara:strand:- start:131 stop:775 length:645 start_codon:yes stop_codon:yes gene_type:complete
MGHVIANVGGVYENYKTTDQKGAVYSHVSKGYQKKCIQFLNEQLFKTPNWMIDYEISNKIETTGITNRIRKTQVNNLNKLLDFARLARMIENEAINKDAYSIVEMMSDVQNGLWSELKTNSKISVYRRSLQKSYVERLDYLMHTNTSELKGSDKYSLIRTRVNVSQSDMISVCRGKLEELRSLIKKKLPYYKDANSKYHLKDILYRIDEVLDPK